MAKSKKKKQSSGLVNSNTHHLPRPKKQNELIFQQHSGPLPDPGTLAHYNSIVPDAAERIITMAEQQAAHRRKLEELTITSDIENSKKGLLYGLIIGLTAVIGGVLCILTGNQVGGSIIGGTGLTGLVGVFVYGSRQKRKEREGRIKAITSK